MKLWQWFSNGIPKVYNLELGSSNQQLNAQGFFEYLEWFIGIPLL